MKKQIPKRSFIVLNLFGSIFMLTVSCKQNNLESDTEISEENITNESDVAPIPAILQKKINALSVSDSDVPDHSDYLYPEYFDLVKSYLKSQGDSSVVDVSGNSSGRLLVTYHEIVHNNWKITVDHTDRIYFSTNHDSLHFGNILYNRNFQNLLYEEDKVVIEMTYGIGREQTKEEIEEDKKQAKILREEYNLFVEEILSQRNNK